MLVDAGNLRPKSPFDTIREQKFFNSIISTSCVRLVIFIHLYTFNYVRLKKLFPDFNGISLEAAYRRIIFFKHLVDDEYTIIDKREASIIRWQFA
jgi:hypothetical protein